MCGTLLFKGNQFKKLVFQGCKINTNHWYYSSMQQNNKLYEMLSGKFHETRSSVQTSTILMQN